MKEAEILAAWKRPGDVERARELLKASLDEGESGRAGKPVTRLLFASVCEPGDPEALGNIQIVLSRSEVRSSPRKYVEALTRRADWFEGAAARQGGSSGQVLYHVARKDALEAAVIYDKFRDWRNLAQMRAVIARSYAASDDPAHLVPAMESALAAVKAAISAMGSISAPDDRDRFFRDFEPQASMALRLAEELGDSDAALTVHEGSRSAGLAELVTAGRSSLPDAIREAWEGMKAARVVHDDTARKLAESSESTADGDGDDGDEGDDRVSVEGHRRAMLRLPDEHAEMASKFALAWGKGASLLTDREPPGTKDLLECLPSSLVLSFRLLAKGDDGSARLHRWWRLPDGTSGCDAVVIDGQASSWLIPAEPWDSTLLDGVLDHATEVLLPEPIIVALRNACASRQILDLAVLPSGQLWSFPWAGLRLDDTRLVTCAAIRLLPSLAAVIALDGPAADQPRSGASAVFDDSLPGAIRERSALLALDELSPVVELARTVENVLSGLAAAATLATLALHGLRESGGLDQALVLEPDNEFLCAGHLFLTHAPPTLVAGACWSASIDGSRFDPIGFPQVALSRGARTFIGGVFGIHDETTGEVLSRFYQEFASGVHPVEALRRAQAAWFERPRSMKVSPTRWAGLVAVNVDRTVPF